MRPWAEVLLFNALAPLVPLSMLGIARREQEELGRIILLVAAVVFACGFIGAYLVPLLRGRFDTPSMWKGRLGFVHFMRWYFPAFVGATIAKGTLERLQTRGFDATFGVAVGILAAVTIGCAFAMRVLDRQLRALAAAGG